jgi:zinc/manganese transport system substrate-binding protein
MRLNLDMMSCVTNDRAHRRSRSTICSRALCHRRQRAGLTFAALAAILAAGALALAGCGSKEPSEESASGKPQVVVAENFWGSLAAQLGGQKVSVRSIVVDPGADPHSYEPNAGDARAMAGAQMAIVNGIGYDEWASRLLAANPSGERTVLDVGKLLGYKQGDNPHQWYSPVHVHAVIDQIVANYDRMLPADAAYFAERKRQFERVGLARYTALIAQIRARYAGVPVGYSESIFQPLGEALGLRLLTPYSFAKAIAEGGEVSAQDKQTVDRQVSAHEIDVWVLNSQNVTPDVQRVSELARAAHIPIARVTETLSPASDSFEQWQVAELEGLQRALRQATGR